MIQVPKGTRGLKVSRGLQVLRDLRVTRVSRALLFPLALMANPPLSLLARQQPENPEVMPV